MKKILFGEGAGKLSESNLGVNPMAYYYGIRCGARMASAWIVLQIGLVGTFIYFFILLRMLLFVINTSGRIFQKLVFIGIFITIILDTSFVFYVFNKLFYHGRFIVYIFWIFLQGQI